VAARTRASGTPRRSAGQQGLDHGAVDELADPCFVVGAGVVRRRGQETTVTLSYKKAVFHQNVDSAGGFHFTFTGTGAITTTDDFSGRFTLWAGANVVAGGDVAVETFTFSATLRNGSGQLVNAHFVAHVTVIDGTPVVEVAVDSLECRGKPS
jgi:hypothetical protein